MSESVHAEPYEVIERPNYRVNSWQEVGQAWVLEAYVFIDVLSVTEVHDWIGKHSSGRRFELFAEMNHEPPGEFQAPRTSGLIRLLGSNPNAGNISQF